VDRPRKGRWSKGGTKTNCGGRIRTNAPAYWRKNRILLSQGSIAHPQPQSSQKKRGALLRRVGFLEENKFSLRKREVLLRRAGLPRITSENPFFSSDNLRAIGSSGTSSSDEGKFS